jgi:hypothetical protein
MELQTPEENSLFEISAADVLLAKRKTRSGQTGTCHGQWRLLSKTESLSI